MLNYRYVEKIGEFLLPLIFLYNIYDNEKYYPGVPVNVHKQPLINIIREKNWAITTKKGKGELPLFCGKGERVITIYGVVGWHILFNK